MADTETTEVMNLDDYVLLPEELVQELADAIRKATNKNDDELIKFSDMDNMMSDTLQLSSSASYSVDGEDVVVTLPDIIYNGHIVFPSYIAPTKVVFPNMLGTVGWSTWFYSLSKNNPSIRVLEFHNLTRLLTGDLYNCDIPAFIYTSKPPTAPWALEGISAIYVPDNLVNTYKTTTNYTVIADKIKGMSEYGN